MAVDRGSGRWGGRTPGPDARRDHRQIRSRDGDDQGRQGVHQTRGVIAARYAAAAGEDPETCAILEDYHRPRSAADGLPASREAAVLSIADRCDTLAGCWLAGFAPTGAKDPYALRRHALALIRILLDLDVRVHLSAVFARALEGFADRAEAPQRSEACDELGAFVSTRLEGTLTSAGSDLATVRAVLPVRSDDPGDAAAWTRALEGFRSEDDFLKLAQGFKRCRNILDDEVPTNEEFPSILARWRDGGRGSQGEDFGKLPEKAEQDLLDAIRTALPELGRLEADRDYVGVYKTLSVFGPLIDSFFDSVRVNVENENLRQLRRGFLRESMASLQATRISAPWPCRQFVIILWFLRLVPRNSEPGPIRARFF